MSATAGSFDRVFRRYRRDAVLLHRPYPPHAGRRTSSWLGGLPGLPARHDWPRASDGTPLHFFAQIDCADVAFPTPLPDRGVLYFFGRDDDEHIWNDGGPASDDCRVLYALDASAATPRREAPADLQQVGGSYGREVWPGFAREGGRGTNLRDEWPVQPLPIASWPDALPDSPDSRLLALRDLLRSRETSRGGVWDRWRAGINMLLAGLDPDTEEDWQEVEARERRYKEELERLRAAAFTEATGDRPVRDPNVIIPEPGAGRAVFFHAEEGPRAYPQYWVTVRHCALALLYRPANVCGSDPVVMARLASAAEDWLRRANQAGLDEAVPEEERGAFRAWLTGLRRPGDEAPLSSGAAQLVFASTYATVGSWAGDPSRAARLPPAAYEAVRYAFDSFSGSRVQFWQMLGHAPSPQRPPPPDDPAVCLLADPGGFCTFWIAPEDLARRDFSKVWGRIEGD
jgi:hypothetical protein